MRGRLPYAIALLLGGCTIQREIPLDRFACASGGPCDAGIVPPADDAGFPDATEGKDVPPSDVPDALPDTGETPDAGEPLAACLKIQPMQSDGLVGGDSTAELNTYEPPCSAPGGRDVVYGFTAPGTLRELTISTGGSLYDTALHFYRDECTPNALITCNDETDGFAMGAQRTSFIRLENVAAGSYAIVVDAFGPTEAGTYQLSVVGKLAPGEPCDPTQLFLSCEIGACEDDGTGAFRCPNVLDCVDGIDADEDGALDEDSCTDPPGVSCTQVAMPIVGDPVDLNATVFDQGGITYRQWRVIERPFGSFDDPLAPNQDTTMFYPDIAGSFRIRYRAADALHQLSSCEVAFTTEVIDGLRVEVIWNGEDLFHEHHSLLSLHLLHPNASRWFDATLDCSVPDCLYALRDWGQQGQQQDDPFLVGLYHGPQWVSVYTPQTSGTYGVGVEYAFDNFRPSTSVVVNIYCYGVLERTFGPTALTNGGQFSPDNDFWKVAEVDMFSGGCDVMPYLNGSEPQIVTGRDAEAAR